MQNFFTLHERAFGWDEIRAAAQAWGEWEGFAAATARGLAAVQYASANNCLPASAAVQAAANEFRYARQLVSAQDAQAWLAAWGLSANDWLAYFRRTLLQEKMKESVAQRELPPVTPAEVEAVLQVEALCSGKLGVWAERLAGRSAVVARFGGVETVRRAEIAALDAAFENCRRKLLDPAALRQQIAHNYLDWIRFDCRYLWFAEERVAREAALCVRHDGLSLDEVAHDARAVVREWSFYLDELAPAARGPFVAAQRGDWLGPLSLLAGFPLLAITGKTLPDETDPQIRQRAEAALVGHSMKQAMNEAVRWNARLA